MSIYNPHGDITPILGAAEDWKKRCLLKDGSVFTKEELWTKANFELLQKYFVERLDGSKKSFLEKLRGQLGDAPPQTNKLVAELLWITYLPATHLRLSTKKKEICEVWGLSGEELDEGHPEFTRVDGIAGIGGMGMVVTTLKPSVLIYFIRFMLHWKGQLTTEEREGLIEDPQSFAQALEKWEQSEPTTVGKEEGGFVEGKMEFKDRYLHSSLLYLLFPDYFERIFSWDHKREIAKKLKLMSKEDADEKLLSEIDKHLYEYRKKKEEEWGIENEKPSSRSIYDLLLSQIEHIENNMDVKNCIHEMIEILLNESLLPPDEIEKLQKGGHTGKWFGKTSSLYPLLQSEKEKHDAQKYWRQVYPYQKKDRYHIRSQWDENYIKDNKNFLRKYLEYLISIETRITENIKGLDYYHAPLALKENWTRKTGCYWIQASEIRETEKDDVPIMSSMNNLNQILYGPPGTGKTYRTRRLALEIIDGKDKAKTYKNGELKDRYEELSSQGRIVFTTFHQSLGYEEFVEGIKPRIQDDPSSSDGAELNSEHSSKNQIQYEIQDGIFKTIADRASRNTIPIPHKELLNQGPKVWKISLGDQGQMKEVCFKNDYIAIGWDHGDLNKEEIYEEYINDKDKRDHSINAFYSHMSIGDLFIVYQNKSKNQAGAAAVGVITGDYYYDNNKDAYKYTRKVKWLWIQKNKNEYIDVHAINGSRSLTRLTVHKTSISPNDLLRKVEEKLAENKPKVSADEAAKYVLIIDEINRGNISKILGELITLIEDNKRAGNDEAMKVILPYSKKMFEVPNNLYIIGTMNTADRSIAFLDTALRRRFRFIEMMPNYKVLEDRLTAIEGINIPGMLRAINTHITKLHDRNHQIGHSYFLRLSKSADADIETLADIFKNEIIPLLREYFHDDETKIKEVLQGDEFLGEGDDLRAELQKPKNYQSIYKNADNPPSDDSSADNPQE